MVHQIDPRLETFINRFQKEAIGLVYYPAGLGRGGHVLSFDEANSFITEYADLLQINERWFKYSAKTMIASLIIGALIGFNISGKLAIIVFILSIAGFGAMAVNTEVSPWFYRQRLCQALRHKLTSAPMLREERILRGYASSYWKIVLFYFIGFPILILFISLKINNKAIFVEILGPQNAENYIFIIKTFLWVGTTATLIWLFLHWWKNARKN